MHTDASLERSAPSAPAVPPSGPDRGWNWLDLAIVSVVAVGLALVVFAASAPAWFDDFVGDGGVDALGTQWFYWLLGRRVLTGEPFAHTDLLFYPWGKDVYLHTGGNVLDAALALPFRFLLGPAMGFNVYVVALLAANGLAAARLARGLGAGMLGAGLAAVLFALNPYVLGEVAGGRPTQALLAFSCLFVGAWLRVLDGSADHRAALRNAAAAGLWLGLSGLAYWFYALFSVVVGVAVAAARLARPARGDSRARLIGRLALAGSVAATIAMPLAWPMLSALSHGEVPGLLDVGSWTLSSWAPTTIEGWKVGVEAFDLWSGQIGIHADLGEGPTFLPERAGVLVVQAVLLLVGVAATVGRRRWMLLAMVFVGLLLAVGPAIDHRLGLTNAAYVVATWVVAPLQRLWWPSRALGVVHVLAVPLVAMGIDRLAGAERWRHVLSGVVLAGLAGTELLRVGAAPMVTFSAEVPTAYHCLAEQDGAILEIPYAGHPEQLLFQAVHGRPRFGGMLEDNPVFAPAEHVAFRESNGLVAAMFAAASGKPVEPAPTDADREAVRALGFAYVVVENEGVGAHTDARGRNGARRRALRTLADLLGQPVFVDEQTTVFAPWGAPWSCPTD